MKTIEVSATVAISNMAALKRAQNEKVHDFSAGDPKLANHPCILEAAASAIAHGHMPYPPVLGKERLRTLFADWMNSQGANYSKEQVLVTSGAKFGLYATLNVLLHPGDEVLIGAPYWVSYPELVRMNRGKAITMPTSEQSGWKLKPCDLEKHATPKSKVLILNSAANPTGAVYSREELGDLLDCAKKLALTVISDEVYSALVFDGASYTSLSSFHEHREHLVVIQSMSKNFAMTGWRVGYVLAPEEILSKIAAFQGQSLTSCAAISQDAAIGALVHADQVVHYVKEAMSDRRTAFVDTFNRLFDGPIQAPDSALYAFIPLTALTKETSSVRFCKELIERHNVMVVPGAAFGVEGMVRFAYSAGVDEIEQGLQHLKEKQW